MHCQCPRKGSWTISAMRATSTSKSVPIAMVPRPAETIMLSDWAINWRRSQPGPRWNGGKWMNCISGQAVLLIHNQGFNACWADGHAKWMKASQAQYGGITDNPNFAFPGTGNGNDVINSVSYYNPYKK